MSLEIIYISIILWLLPLIKNFRKEYFLFFVAIAVQDPGNLLFFYLLKLNPNYWVIICELFMIGTLKTANKKLDKLSPYIITITLIVLISGFHPNLITMLLEIILLIKVSINIIEELKCKGCLNMFIMMIAFYILNLVLKTLFVSTQSLHRETYYVYTLISMFAFALFFTFTNEKSKFLQINIKKYLVIANDHKNHNSR